MEKDRKKTLTISTSLKKKIDTSVISSDGKKSFAVEKKKPFRPNKNYSKNNYVSKPTLNTNAKKKNLHLPNDLQEPQSSGSYQILQALVDALDNSNQFYKMW